jgi:hypothetical protein
LLRRHARTAPDLSVANPPIIERTAVTTWLTPHFSLEELTATQQRHHDNTPPEAVRAALQHTAERMEEVRRTLDNRVVTVNSGYRSPGVNQAVGGAKNSAHLSGLAVDFNCYGFGAPKAVCRAIAESDLSFDQLIEEGHWVHISFDARRRRQVLTKAGGGYRRGLT